MAAPTRRAWIYWCQIFVYFLSTAAHLDIEELRNIQYKIDILSDPVLLINDIHQEVFHLSSKFGQSYQCSLPGGENAEQQQKDKEKEATEIGISELLRPMESGPCLIYTKDWWSYELCYGKTVRQFHMENGLTVEPVMVLGKFDSEKVWNKSEDSSTRRLERYHSQSYVNGSKCDLTGNNRTVEVRFICEEGQGDRIASIDEPGTCNYVMTVYTYRICHHPYLKPPASRKPKTIICRPALDSERFDEYLSVRRDKKSDEKVDEGPPKIDHTFVRDEKPATTQFLEVISSQKTQEKQLAEDTILDEKSDEKVDEGLSETESYKSENDKTILEDSNENPSTEDIPGVTSSQKTLQKQLDEDQRKILDEFDKEVDKLGDRRKLSKFKKAITDEMHSKFDSIIDEAKAETGQGDEDLDKPQMYKHLKQILDAMMNSLDNDPKGMKGETGKEAYIAKKPHKKSPESETDIEDSDEGKWKGHVSTELEKSVEKELLKAGITTNGKKIRVKIISASTAKDGSVALTDADKKAFNNMVVSLLGGGTLAIEASKKQQDMEDGYNYVYKKSSVSKQKTTFKDIPDEKEISIPEKNDRK